MNKLRLIVVAGAALFAAVPAHADPYRVHMLVVGVS